MKLVAITGSIGCGKTTIAKVVKQLGYPVFDVDGWVRRLYFNKDFIKAVAKAFPQVREGEGINKRRLRNVVFSDNNELKRLEAMIHPFLKDYLKYSIRKYAQNCGIFFIDVALLFEMGWDRYCDFIIVADVDYDIQKQRVMKRDNVSAEDFDKINDIQMKNEHKIRLADIVVRTDKSLNLLKAEMIDIIKGLEQAYE